MCERALSGILTLAATYSRENRLSEKKTRQNEASIYVKLDRSLLHNFSYVTQPVLKFPTASSSPAVFGEKKKYASELLQVSAQYCDGNFS